MSVPADRIDFETMSTEMDRIAKEQGFDLQGALEKCGAVMRLPTSVRRDREGVEVAREMREAE